MPNPQAERSEASIFMFSYFVMYGENSMPNPQAERSEASIFMFSYFVMYGENSHLSVGGRGGKEGHEKEFTNIKNGSRFRSCLTQTGAKPATIFDVSCEFFFVTLGTSKFLESSAPASTKNRLLLSLFNFLKF